MKPKYIKRNTSVPVDLTICPHCGRHASDIAVRRLNTSYVDDERNFETSCSDCYEESVAYYADLWSDFYSGRF